MKLRGNIFKNTRLVAALVVLAVIILGYFLAASAPMPGAPNGTFTVSQNTGTSAIIEGLKTHGFIKTKWAFSLALTLQGTNRILPGGYEISKGMSAWQLAKALYQGPTQKWISIPEGLRKEEIAEILAKQLSWSAAEKQKWIDVYTAPDSDHTEGVYFPDTYLIPNNESPADTAKRLRNHFEEKFAPAAKEAAKQNIKWDTLLKIASLVQREAGGQTDMPIIAGIIWNRLLQGMKLDIDATIQYARGNTGNGWWAPISASDKQLDTPYNTYMYKGLPPHPICNPGLEAINAVLHPSETKCLYYLHDSNGQIHCAETYEQHLQNVATYLR